MKFSGFTVIITRLHVPPPSLPPVNFPSKQKFLNPVGVYNYVGVARVDTRSRPRCWLIPGLAAKCYSKFPHLRILAMKV